MWLSFIAFLLAGVIVLYFGWGVVSKCAEAVTAPAAGSGAATPPSALDWL